MEKEIRYLMIIKKCLYITTATDNNIQEIFTSCISIKTVKEDLIWLTSYKCEISIFFKKFIRMYEILSKKTE